MKARSVVERGIKDSKLIQCQLDNKEKKVFNKIKRSLLRTFVNPNHSVKILIDLSALEYIRYVRGLLDEEINSSKVAKTIIDCLSELDMTPKSKKTTEVSKTLSQIFSNLTGEENHA